MNDTLNTLQNLHTTRENNFSDRAIGDEDLQTILKASVRAATGSGRQSYSIVVVDDEVKRQFKWPGAKVLLYCADCNRLVDLATAMDQPLNPGNPVQFLTAVIDTTLALQTAVVAAEALGIGSLITNRVYQGGYLPQVYEALNLPREYCFPVALLCLGYPKEQPAYRKGRVDGPGVVHQGRYQRLSPEAAAAMVARYDDPAQHFGIFDGWRAQGFDHYLQWLLVTWGKRPGLADAMASFRETLNATGFLD